MGYVIGGLAVLFLLARSKGLTLSQEISTLIPGVPSGTIGNIGPGATLGGTQAKGTSYSVPGAIDIQALTGNLAPNPACGCTLQSSGYQPAGVATQRVTSPTGAYAAF